MTRAALRSTVLAGALLIGMDGQDAWAGPPVLWHPFDIGTANSLPWGASRYWWQGDPDYDIQRLVADTEALLTPAMPVIVRMETLRRAAVYASLDTALAERLLARIRARVPEPGLRGRDHALGWFDAAYLTATLRQIGELTHEAEFRARALRVRDLPGLKDTERLLQGALERRPDDSAIAFGAAIIAAGQDVDASRAYAARARRGVERDPLLAANIGHLH